MYRVTLILRRGTDTVCLYPDTLAHAEAIVQAAMDDRATIATAIIARMLKGYGWSTFKIEQRPDHIPPHA